MKNGRKGFTLIELLVVIAIIGILAAMVFPVFARARETARKATCLSNTKQIALGLLMYCDDYDGTLPMAYYYQNGANSNIGYVQWSGLIEPYVKNWSVFVCPSHLVGGWAPTCFTTPPVNPPAGQVPLQDTKPSVDPLANDVQAPRLSYTANEIVMPRLKYADVPQNVVKLDRIDNAVETITVCEYTDFIECLIDSSPTGGDAVKSHRPVNAVMYEDGAFFDGESYGAVDHGAICAIDTDVALAEIAAAKEETALGHQHIVYLGADRHLGGANYCFADGHAAWVKLSQTLNPDKYLWGKQAYSSGGASIIRYDLSGPVS
jgi:prepilin-type N-terminal cleavage/methylation domain-containing protein/prepilin-type processing-associated H-X9-DG protein